MATATDDAIQGFDGTPTEVISQTADVADDETVGGQTVFDNTSDLWTYAIATLFVTSFGADPSSGTVDLYCMKGNIGSGAEDEDAGGITYGTALTTTNNETQTAGLHYMGTYSFDVDTGAQRRAITIPLVGIKEAYFYIKNTTGTSLGQPITVDIEGGTYTPRPA